MTTAAELPDMLSSIPCDKNVLSGLRHRRAVVVMACIVTGVVLYHAWSSVDQRIAQYASADVCKVSTIHKDEDVIALDRIESYLQVILSYIHRVRLTRTGPSIFIATRF